MNAWMAKGDRAEIGKILCQHNITISFCQPNITSIEQSCVLPLIKLDLNMIFNFNIQFESKGMVLLGFDGY